MAYFSEHRFYMPSHTQQKYFYGIEHDIPPVSTIETCIYDKAYERISAIDDTFLKTIPHLFIDCIPMCFLDGGLGIIQEQEYIIKFAFSISELDQNFSIKSFADKLNSYNIDFFYIIGDEDFEVSLELFKEQRTRHTNREDYCMPLTNKVIYVCFDDDEGEHLGNLMNFFEEIVIVSNKEVIDLNSTFENFNVDGNLSFKSTDLRLINNYSIKIVV